jgi:hypothetical protein
MSRCELDVTSEESWVQAVNLVAAQVQHWLDEGVAFSSIGITARTRQDLRAVEGALRDITISFSELRTDGGNPEVRISTMHSSKGLEFARLAVVAVNGDNMLHPLATTPISEAQCSMLSTYFVNGACSMWPVRGLVTSC